MCNDFVECMTFVLIVLAWYEVAPALPCWNGGSWIESLSGDARQMVAFRNSALVPLAYSKLPNKRAKNPENFHPVSYFF